MRAAYAIRAIETTPACGAVVTGGVAASAAVGVRVDAAITMAPSRAMRRSVEVVDTKISLILQPPARLAVGLGRKGRPVAHGDFTPSRRVRRHGGSPVPAH